MLFLSCMDAIDHYCREFSASEWNSRIQITREYSIFLLWIESLYGRSTNFSWKICCPKFLVSSKDHSRASFIWVHTCNLNREILAKTVSFVLAQDQLPRWKLFHVVIQLVTTARNRTILSNAPVVRQPSSNGIPPASDLYLTAIYVYAYINMTTITKSDQQKA